MMDDGIWPVELTGRWVGFYRHRWEQMGTFPIIAEISQSRDTLTGEMYDQVTDRSEILDRVLEIVRDDTSAGNRRKMENAISQFGREAVVRNSRLPDTSDIRGTLKGTLVEFTKTYRGSYVVNWVAKGREIGTFQRTGHFVQYSGQLNREAMCIEGKWVIRKPGLLGRFLSPQDWGSFELYKKS